MKIAFLTDHLYLHGGIEKVLVEKANYFADKLKYEVFILTTQQLGKPSCYPLSDKVILMDLDIKYNRSKSYFTFSNLSKAKGHFAKRKSTLKQINPDIVIVSNYDFDFFWTPFIHKPSKKIKEYHSSQYIRNKKHSFKKKLISIFTNYIESKYDALVVLNKDEQSFFKSKNTVIIPNSISIPPFMANLDKKQVLAAGRIAPVKGFDRLIDAWSAVVKKHPEWKLHIYGEDYLNTQLKLEKQIRNLNIEKKVVFKGVSRNMTQTMEDYSFYLMSSLSESFSMVIVESFSVGLPVIAFDVPTGPRNLITHKKDGLLVEDNDLNGYIKAINYMIEDITTRKKMGKEAKLKSQEYEIENILNQWLDLFENLINSNH